MEEIWKDVVGYEGKYQASNMGRIKSLPREYKIIAKSKNQFSNKIYESEKIIKVKGKIKKLTLGYNGYYVVNLGYRDLKSVHRLIAECFCTGYSYLRRITNHKNGIKTDNRADNLEWASYSENLKHAYETGLNRRRKKSTTVEKYR